MKINWLWDTPRMSESKVKRIFKNDQDPRFFIYAKKLFLRVKNPDHIFSLMDKVIFCSNWPVIKEKIQTDLWFAHMADYWQGIYEKTVKELKGRGVPVHRFPDIKISPQRLTIARQLRKIRQEAGYTQRQAARLLGVKQQYISLIETGRENLSVDSLLRIAAIYFKRCDVVFRN